MYVAIYGTSFTTAGRAVIRLVQEQGLTTILSGLVADTVIGYGAFFSALVGTGCAAAASSALWTDDGLIEPPVRLAVVCLPTLILTAMLGSTCLSPVRAGIRTLLVCFA